MKAQVNSMLEIETIHKVDKICKDIGITRSEFIRVAVEEYIHVLEEIKSANEEAYKDFVDNGGLDEV